MGGMFSVGGLITGLDTNNLIQQLIQLERQPIIRIQQRIEALEQEQEAVRGLRTQLLTLRNRAQDFRFDTIFDQFEAVSSETGVLGAEVSGSNPVAGSYDIEVTQLASATVATSSGVLGAAINPGAALDSSGIGTDILAGDFTINGVTFTVDPSTQSLNDILGQINASSAGVTATYDAVSDTVAFENSTPGDTSLINFGASDDDSNFLSAINVTQATQSTGGNGSTVATSTRNLGAISPGETLNTVSFGGGAITAGDFKVNGITITVDPTTDSLGDVLARINDSDAQVTASYDSSTDTIRVVSKTLGSRTIGFTAGTSNFLSVTNLAGAVQDAGDDAQFTINGGAAQTRNTNEVSDAIGGVTLNLLSLGTSTVTVSTDDDAIVEGVQEFLTAFNNSVDEIESLVGIEGALSGDGTLRSIENFMWSTIFSQVSGISGDFRSLVDIGITTGDAFESGSVSHLELDEETFREALRDDRVNVKGLFANTDGTAIADQLFDYLDDVTKITGFLNARAKDNGTIDMQIRSAEDQIERLEERLVMREERLRLQFSRLEQLSAQYQSQSTALSGLASGFSVF